MAVITSEKTPKTRLSVIWVAVGLALLTYAVLGNYLVLPGYRRFVEGGGAGGSGASGAALVWGAARTILWMLSFQLGTLCLSLAVLRTYGDAARRFRRWFIVGVGVWLVVWSLPTLPSPSPSYFAAVGVVIVVAISGLFWMTGARQAGGVESADTAGPWRIASFYFFAAATWEMCGLGSVGGILRPNSDLHAANTTLVATQATKLILELAIAWLLALAAVSRRSSSLPSSGRR